MSAIAVSHLDLSRAGRVLIKDLDFHLDSGRITVVLGPNGAGKSSLLMALAGMLDCDAGEVRINGKALADFHGGELAACLAWQGSLPSAEFGLTVEQRLQLAMHSGLNNDIDREKQLAACAKLDVSDLRQRVLGELSSGERQRVELAALLVRDCPIWLLDEPCAHLDIRHQVAWLQLMREKAQSGKAMLAVLHDIQQAAAIADDVILVYGDGRVRAGEASALLVPDVLSDLFQTDLQRVSGGLLIPDYRGAMASSLQGCSDEGTR